MTHFAPRVVGQFGKEVNNLIIHNELFYILWWSYPLLGGLDMRRINISQFYRLGQVLHPLSELEAGKPLKDYYLTLFTAHTWIEFFLNDQMIPMTICEEAARKIIYGIKGLLPTTQKEREKVDMERIISYGDLYNITEGVKEFETVFSAEVQNMATYFVSKKGIYDTNDLITNADNLLSENVKKWISEQAIIDIREAGRCLAFDLATATGFHIARAVERVLVDYLTLLCTKKVEELKDGQRNLGAYIKLTRDNGGDEKVCSSLDQFRDLHRNPLMHPEAVLTVDDAITLLGIAQSAIVAMTLEMGKLKTK